MSNQLTYLDAALLAQTAAKAQYEELQDYSSRFPKDHKALSQLQEGVSLAYRQARICYDMWALYVAKVPPPIIRDWVLGRGYPC